MLPRRRFEAVPWEERATLIQIYDKSLSFSECDAEGRFGRPENRSVKLGKREMGYLLNGIIFQSVLWRENHEFVPLLYLCQSYC